MADQLLAEYRKCRQGDDARPALNDALTACGFAIAELAFTLGEDGDAVHRHVMGMMAEVAVCADQTAFSMTERAEALAAGRAPASSAELH